VERNHAAGNQAATKHVAVSRPATERATAHLAAAAPRAIEQATASLAPARHPARMDAPTTGPEAAHLAGRPPTDRRPRDRDRHTAAPIGRRRIDRATTGLVTRVRATTHDAIPVGATRHLMARGRATIRSVATTDPAAPIGRTRRDLERIAPTRIVPTRIGRGPMRHGPIVRTTTDRDRIAPALTAHTATDRDVRHLTRAGHTPPGRRTARVRSVRQTSTVTRWSGKGRSSSPAGGR
jgi:hypothetical protein